MEKVWKLILRSVLQGHRDPRRGRVICSAWEHHTKHMEIYFFIAPHPHRESVKIQGAAGGWLVRSGSQTLLLSNWPRFIYILTFGVIFPGLCVMHLCLVGVGSLPFNPQTHSQWARAVISQGSVALRTEFSWSPEQPEVMLPEKPLQQWRASFFWPLHPSGCGFWLPMLRFNPMPCWQDSNFKILGELWWVNKTSVVLVWGTSVSHPCLSNGISPVMQWLCTVQLCTCQPRPWAAQTWPVQHRNWKLDFELFIHLNKHMDNDYCIS